MKRTKKIIFACSLALGIGAGAIIFTPSGSNAASNVVLASVDWVNSVINPINSKITAMQSQINTLQTTVTELQTEINNLKSGTLPSVVYVNKTSVNIYSGASSGYKIIATKKQGTALTVIDKFTASTGIWYRVSLSSTLKGWVFSGDVSTSKVSSTSVQTVVTTASANLRKGASNSYASIQVLPTGTTLKYIQSFTNSLGENWYNVETSAGVRGWIPSSLGEVK